MLRKLLIPAMLLIAACAVPYSLPTDDRADIAAHIASFERAFVKGNTAEAINVVPPRMIAVIAQQGGTKLQLDNTMLTLEEGGEWHLARIDEDRQIDLMRRVYPDFKDVTFPKSTSKVIG
ncbi:hypothetical protein [Sulfitobacter sp.]|uniref:hypothetical protein n=1 Tax=Sulfitobacter sp. TaxID=1903071 RepID=UPI0030033AE3